MLGRFLWVSSEIPKRITYKIFWESLIFWTFFKKIFINVSLLLLILFLLLQKIFQIFLVKSCINSFRGSPINSPFLKEPRNLFKLLPSNCHGNSLRVLFCRYLCRRSSPGIQEFLNILLLGFLQKFPGDFFWYSSRDLFISTS